MSADHPGWLSSHHRSKNQEMGRSAKRRFFSCNRAGSGLTNHGDVSAALREPAVNGHSEWNVSTETSPPSGEGVFALNPWLQTSRPSALEVGTAPALSDPPCRSADNRARFPFLAARFEERPCSLPPGEIGSGGYPLRSSAAASGGRPDLLPCVIAARDLSDSRTAWSRLWRSRTTTVSTSARRPPSRRVP